MAVDHDQSLKKHAQDTASHDATNRKSFLSQKTQEIASHDATQEGYSQLKAGSVLNSRHMSDVLEDIRDLDQQFNKKVVEVIDNKGSIGGKKLG